MDLDNLVQEIHNLAYFYHWGYQECWHVPSSKRILFNDRIRIQLKAEVSGGSVSSPTKNKYTENTSRF